MILRSQKTDPYGLIAQSMGPSSNLLGRFFDLPDIGLSEPESFSVDIKEFDDCYKIFADIPGYKKDDVTIDLENNLLTISASKSSDEKAEEKGKYVRRERRTTSFSRGFHLPKHIDETAVNAKLDNGVLELTLPKVAASARKSISVE